jgi:hypothetical protein
MARSNQRGRRNNNPEGRNQYSSSSWMDSARDRPIAAAATAAAAVGAGVFLWSKRNQISEQLTNLSDQISDWTDGMRSSDPYAEIDQSTEAAASPTGSLKPASRRSSRKTQQQLSEEALTLKETGDV